MTFQISENSSIEEIKAAINYSKYAQDVVLKHVADSVKDNREIVELAVAKIGWNLEYASERLRDDEDIVYSAIASGCSHALGWASERLRKDRDFILSIYDNRDACVCKYADDTLKNDRDFMLKVIRKKPSDIQYSPLHHDVAFICTAFYHHINLFKYLVNDIKQNPVVLALTLEFSRQHPESAPLDHIFLKELTIDKKALAIEIIIHHKASYSLYNSFNEELRKQDDFIDAYLKQDPHLINYIPKEQVTKQRLIACLESDRFWLHTGVIPDELKTDQALLEVIARTRTENFSLIPEDNPYYASLLEIGIKNDGCLIEKLPVEKKSDQALVRMAVRSNSCAIRYLEHTEENKPLILQILSKSGLSLRVLPDFLRDDDEYVKAALSSGEAALKYASDRLKFDKEMVKYAVKCNTGNLKYAHEKFHFHSDILASGTIFYHFNVATCKGGQHLIPCNSHMKVEYPQGSKKRVLDFLFRNFRYIKMNTDGAFLAKEPCKSVLYDDWRALQCFMHILLVTQMKYPSSQDTPALARLPGALLGMFAEFLCGDIPGFMPLRCKSVPRDFHFKKNPHLIYSGNADTIMAKSIIEEYKQLVTAETDKRDERNHLAVQSTNREEDQLPEERHASVPKPGCTIS